MHPECALGVGTVPALALLREVRLVQAVEGGLCVTHSPDTGWSHPLHTLTVLAWWLAVYWTG